MPLLVVGSVALDAIETPQESRENVLGGSAVFFSYAASYFTSVKLVSVVGEDWPSAHTELLRGRNIDTAGLQVVVDSQAQAVVPHTDDPAPLLPRDGPG